MTSPYTYARFFISLKGAKLTVHALVENSTVFDLLDQSLENSMYLPMYIEFPDLNFDEATLFMSYKEIASECSVKLVKVDQKFFLKPDINDFKQALSPFKDLPGHQHDSLDEQDVDWRINVPAEISSAQQITAHSQDNDSEPFRQPQIGPRPFTGIRRTGSHKSVEVVGQEGREYRRTRTRPQIDAVGFSEPESEQVQEISEDVQSEQVQEISEDVQSEQVNSPEPQPLVETAAPSEALSPHSTGQKSSANSDKEAEPEWLVGLNEKQGNLTPSESQRSLDLPHTLAQDAALTFLKEVDKMPPPQSSEEGFGKDALIAAWRAWKDEAAGLLSVRATASGRNWYVYFINGSPVSAFRKPAEQGNSMTAVMTRAGLLDRYDADLVLATAAKQNSNELEIMAQLKVVSGETLKEALSSYINLILRELIELDSIYYSLYPLSPDEVPQINP